jgi:phosphatidate cytidylyltransferase
MAIAFWFLVAPVWLWRGWHVRDWRILALTGWILIVPTWLALVRLQQWPWVLLAVLGVVWIADIAAYFAGHVWGRRKLAPAISPGKTWEGVAGAVLGVAVYHALVWHFGFSAVAPQAAIAAMFLVVCLLPLSILGDLFESWIKRKAGVKDSGRLLPGHGGVLDRIDALTATLPLAAFVVPWLLQRM